MSTIYCDELFNYMALELPEDTENGPNCYGDVLKFMSTCVPGDTPEAKVANFNQYCLNAHKGENFSKLCANTLDVHNNENIYEKMTKLPITEWNIPKIPAAPALLYAQYATAKIQVVVGDTKFAVFGGEMEDQNKPDNIVYGDIATGKITLLTQSDAHAIVMNNSDTLYVLTGDHIQQYDPLTGEFLTVPTAGLYPIFILAAEISGTHIGCIGGSGGTTIYLVDLSGGALWVSHNLAHAPAFLRLTPTGEYMTFARLGGGHMEITAPGRIVNENFHHVALNVSNIYLSGTTYYYAVVLDGGRAVVVSWGDPLTDLTEMSEASRNSIGAYLPGAGAVELLLNSRESIIHADASSSNIVGTLHRPVGDIDIDFNVRGVWPVLNSTYVLGSEVSENQVHLQIMNSTNMATEDPWAYFFSRVKLLLESGDHPTASLKLLDNANLVVSTSAQEILYSANTRDGHTSDAVYLSVNEFTEINLLDFRSYVTSTGKYLFHYGDGKNASFLQFNPVNTVGFLDRCESDRSEDCSSTVQQYCAHKGNPDEGIIDPRCFCAGDPDVILATLFNLEQLKRSPLTYQQLYAMAPCLSAVCNPNIIKEENVIGKGLDRLYNGCAQSIEICTNIIDVRGELNADVIQASCGSETLPCSSGCPVGLVCDNQTNFCTNICMEDAQCGHDQYCDTSTQVCRFENDDNNGSGGLHTAEIVGIISACIILVLIIVLVVLKTQNII